MPDFVCARFFDPVYSTFHDLVIVQGNHLESELLGATQLEQYLSSEEQVRELESHEDALLVARVRLGKPSLIGNMV